MQAVTVASGRIAVWLPCRHQRAYLPSSEPADRRCRTCSHIYLIEYSTGGLDAAAITDISCMTCLGRMESMGDLWFCLRCGDEFDDKSVRGS